MWFGHVWFGIAVISLNLFCGASPEVLGFLEGFISIFWSYPFKNFNSKCFFSPILSLFLFLDIWFSSCQLDVFNSIVHRCGGQREGEHSENPCALKMPRAMCERT